MFALGKLGKGVCMQNPEEGKGAHSGKTTSHALNESGGPITNPLFVQKTGRGFPSFKSRCRLSLFHLSRLKVQPPCGHGGNVVLLCKVEVCLQL